jgi:hypothetical protein
VKSFSSPIAPEVSLQKIADGQKPVGKLNSMFVTPMGKYTYSVPILQEGATASAAVETTILVNAPVG